MSEDINDPVIYAVYKNPKDFPGKYVVRRWNGMAPEQEPLIVADTLEQAQKAIPRFMLFVPPGPDDDPVIIETYI